MSTDDMKTPRPPSAAGDTLSVAEAEALVTRTLMRCNTAQANAVSVARALVAAERAGQSGHGLRRLPSYAAQSLTGKVDGHATPSSEERRPAALFVDAAHGFAYPALDLAMGWMPEAARRQGVVMAGIGRSHHCGVAGLHVEALARQGLVALMFANTPGAMAPWGGKSAVFGTNPIAFAAPLNGAEPVVVDVSLSKVARGKVMAAAQQGQPIPEGWALDAEGRPTTDPQAALKGTMVPLGDAKGTALALMVEMLGAGLVGACYGFEASSFFEAEGPPPGTGQLLIAMDAQALSPDATQRFTMLAEMIEAMDGPRLPGRRRQALARQIDATGIPLDPGLAAQIDALRR